jgi:hypothetical protein
MSFRSDWSLSFGHSRSRRHHPTIVSQTICHSDSEAIMTTEYIVLHVPTNLYSSLTFLHESSRVQVVTDDGRVTSMDSDNALLILAYAKNHPDFETSEVKTYAHGSN